METICEVCNNHTDYCPPSPFSPCSYWRCKECVKAKRIAYWELLCVVCGKDTAIDFDARLRELNEELSSPRVLDYGSAYLLPTIAFFGKSKEEVWAERHQWESHVRDSKGRKKKPLHKLTSEEMADIKNWMPTKEQTEEYFKQFPVE